VEVNGFEPMTFPPAGRDAPSLPNTSINYYRINICLSGGGERIRTDDLLRARQALSQLSYTPGLETRDLILDTRNCILLSSEIAYLRFAS
jgi:hypothetical protein